MPEGWCHRRGLALARPSLLVKLAFYMGEGWKLRFKGLQPRGVAQKWGSRPALGLLSLRHPVRG